MTAAKDFSAAIDQAFDLSKRHEEALGLVQRLARELGETVRAKTSGLVDVALVPTSRFDELHPMTVITRIAGRVKRRELGDDAEDRQVRQFIVARIASGTNRVLWEVEFAANSGYPVTINGPEPDASVTCFGEDDVRAAFVAAAGHGTVGRKLAALLAEAEHSGGDRAHQARTDTETPFHPGARVRPSGETLRHRDGTVEKVPSEARMTVVEQLEDGWVRVCASDDPKVYPSHDLVIELHPDDIEIDA